MMAFFLVMWLARRTAPFAPAIAGYFQEPGCCRTNSRTASSLGTGRHRQCRHARPSCPASRRACWRRAKSARRRGRAHQAAHGAVWRRPAHGQVEVTVTDEACASSWSIESQSSFLRHRQQRARGEGVKILTAIGIEVGKLEMMWW
jgi:hypothetical protein